MPQPYIVIPPTGDGAADEWVQLGCEAQLAEKFDKADKYYRRALSIDSSNATAESNLAVVKAQTGYLSDAITGAQRAELFDPDNALMAAVRSMILAEADLIDLAIDAADRAIALSPITPTKDTDPLTTHGWLAARQARGMLCTRAGQATQAIPYYQAMLAVQPTNLMAGLNVCFNQSLVDLPPVEFLRQRREWRKHHGYNGRLWPYGNDKDPDRVIRVGYVGGDYKIHSAAMIYGNVIPCHDKTKVEPFLYSTSPTKPDQDYMTAMFKACGNWRELHGVNDEDADDMIRNDKIDILVDLASHTLGGRLPLMTRCPAPVQVTAWGFVLGTGLSEIDAFFADPIVIPAEDRQYYAERIVDLPSVVTYRAPVEYQLKAPSPPPFDKNGYITFSCNNRFEKISDVWLAAVAEIMRQVPRSKLILKDLSYRRPYSIRRVYEGLAGIDKKRILFQPGNSHPEHMLAQQEADLCLDPFPHGGGVCMLEALYMGVPIVTRYGTQPAGRLAASVLEAMDWKLFIAYSVEEYISKAVDFAEHPKYLAGWRTTCRKTFMASPVVAGYVGAVENAYRSLWREWCEK